EKSDGTSAEGRVSPADEAADKYLHQCDQDGTRSRGLHTASDASNPRRAWCGTPKRRPGTGRSDSEAKVARSRHCSRCRKASSSDTKDRTTSEIQNKEENQHEAQPVTNLAGGAGP